MEIDFSKVAGTMGHDRHCRLASCRSVTNVSQVFVICDRRRRGLPKLGRPELAISRSEVTFVHNCVGSSSGKKSIPTAREQTKLAGARELYF